MKVPKLSIGLLLLVMLFIAFLIGRTMPRYSESVIPVLTVAYSTPTELAVSTGVIARPTRTATVAPTASVTVTALPTFTLTPTATPTLLSGLTSEDVEDAIERNMAFLEVGKDITPDTPLTQYEDTGIPDLYLVTLYRDSVEFGITGKRRYSRIPSALVGSYSKVYIVGNPAHAYVEVYSWDGYKFVKQVEYDSIPAN